MRLSPILFLAACHPAATAPPPVVQMDRSPPPAAPGRSVGQCELTDQLATITHAHRAAQLTATYPAFFCAADHPRDERLAEVNARLAEATKERFDAFLTTLPIDLPPGSVTLERHCRADTATPLLISVVCTDTIAGLYPEERTHFDTHNLLLTRDRVQPFTVWDTIRDDARASLLELLGRALRDADASRYRDGDAGAPADAADVFTVTEHGLWFHYAEGDVARVSDGTYLIELAWSEVRPLLSESYLMAPLHRVAQPPTCEAVDGYCQDGCQDGFVEADGTCDNGTCCVPDASALPM